MTRTGLLLPPFTLFTLVAAAGCAENPPSTAFTDVSVVDVAADTVAPGMTVVVAGGRITAVGPADAVDVPRGASRIDGTGKFLIPGLWDMHAHTSTDRITREVVFPLFIAYGVTGIRDMAADCFDDEEPTCDGAEDDHFSDPLPSIREVDTWRQEIAAGTLVGPRIVAGSYYLNGPAPGEPSTAYNPGTPGHARAHARLLQERGVDFIKIYSMLPREAYFALADEANRIGIPFAGHVPLAVRTSEASDAGQQSIEHAGFGNLLEECSAREDELRARMLAELRSEQPDLLPLLLELLETQDTEKCAAVAATLVRNGTWLVPTLMVIPLPGEPIRVWRSDPHVRFLAPEERRLWEDMEASRAEELGDLAALDPVSRWIRELTEDLHRAGVRMLAGSDAGDVGVFWGIGLHQELELLASTGFTAAEALRAATLDPAEFWNAADSLGTVEAGKVADLVLLEANPLEDIRSTRRIAGVMSRGRYLDRAALDGLLAQAERGAGMGDSPPVTSEEGSSR